MFDARSRTRAEFGSLWQKRLAGYAAKVEPLEKSHKEAFEAFTKSQFAFARGDDRFDRFFQASLEHGENAGKGELLEAFLKHIATKPSLGLTRAWLQEQVSVANDKFEAAKRSENATKALADRPNLKLGDLLEQAEQGAMDLGRANGHAQELALIIDNFAAYSGEIASADAKDAQMRQRLGAMLGAIGRGMQSQRGWTANCVRTGDFVNCTGR
jgi:hypothetical protein